MNNSSKDEIKNKAKTKTTETAKVQPSCKIIEDQQVCNTDYIGLEESDAMSRAELKELIARVVERNGEFLAVTQELNPNRLDFTVSNDKVSKVEFY